MHDAGLTLRGMILPIFLDRVPKVEEATVIGVAILDNQARDLLGMAQCEAIAYRGAVIHDIHNKLCQFKILDQFLNKVRLAFEGVSERLRVRHTAESVSNVIGRNYMQVRGKRRDEVPKHVGGSRKSVQKKHHRSVGWARFTVENLLVIDG